MERERQQDDSLVNGCQAEPFASYSPTSFEARQVSGRGLTAATIPYGESLLQL